jgi:hypothetical protein
MEILSRGVDWIFGFREKIEDYLGLIEICLDFSDKL